MPSDSDTGVVSVDVTGLATANGAGSATITATKAAGGGYAEATAIYVINATLAEQTISFAQLSPLKLVVGDTPSYLQP